jgi:hypothetical protein
MEKLPWFERVFTFGLPLAMLPFYIERLEGAIPRIENRIKGISEEKLSERLNNKWSIKENIGHLAEVDEIGLKRIGEILSGASPMSRAVFEPKPYHDWPIESVLGFFRETRLRNVQRYAKLSPDELVKSALHPRLGIAMTPVDLAWFDAEHDDHHLVRIKEILSYLSP